MVLEERFTAYVEALASTLAHIGRVEPFAAYCRGLILPGQRKSVEPMAARVRPERVSAAHQSLHHLVAKASWSDEALLAAVRGQVLPALGPVTAPCVSPDAQSFGDGAPASCWCWIVDDTGFPKKGKHSVGVARQYCGQLGKQDNCRVAVSLSVANEQASLPIAYRLYLPEAWAGDPARRAKAGVPEKVRFQTKPQIALEQIRAALKQGVVPGVVLADAGYGADMDFQEGLLALELAYVVGIQPHTSVWPSGTGPLSAKPWSGRGRPPTRLRREAGHAPVAAEAFARSLPAEAWRTVRWREGSKGELASRFAARCVRPGHRDYERRTPWPELWLLVEWPVGETEPTKYWFANLPADTALEHLVALAKLRWRIERDYQELKQELGLGHFEGRGWRGFHHHAALCIAAYGFLVLERARFSPAGTPEGGFKAPALPQGFRPRGSRTASAAPRAALDRQPAPPPGRAARSSARSLPLLRKAPRPATSPTSVMTQ
jgi:SRSO17 transposase